MSVDQVRDAIIDLYMNVKVRPNDEVSAVISRFPTTLRPNKNRRKTSSEASPL